MPEPRPFAPPDHSDPAARGAQRPDGLEPPGPPVVVVALTAGASERAARERGLDPRATIHVHSARSARGMRRARPGVEVVVADPLVRRASWWPLVADRLQTLGAVERPAWS